VVPAVVIVALVVAVEEETLLVLAAAAVVVVAAETLLVLAAAALVVVPEALHTTPGHPAAATDPPIPTQNEQSSDKHCKGAGASSMQHPISWSPP
jgi:hypothetical protein